MPYATNPDDAACLGREHLLSELKDLLDRPTPAHVSLVGPELMGKTVLLRELAQRARAWERFHAVAEWDLRRLTPHDDDAFFDRLGDVLFEALEAVGSTHAGWISGETDLADLQGLVKELRKDDLRLLVILDHLDRPLEREEGLTKDLWDNLRFLAQSGALTLVTATPKPLRLHCPRESKASLFWDIFADPSPILVGPLTEEGIDAFLEPLEAETGRLSPPARKMFAKQTGYSPLLAAVLANKLLERPEEEELAKHVIEAEAEALGDTENDRVAHLWEVAPPPVQAALYEIYTRDQSDDEPISADAFPEDRLADLKSRGYVTVHSSGNVAPGARIMLRYAGRHGASQSDLARLFIGDKADINKKALLRLELKAVQGGDPDLRTSIDRAIQELSPWPAEAIKKLRSFSEACLKSVLHHILPDGSVPGPLLFKIYYAGKGSSDKSRARASSTILRLYPAVDKPGTLADQPTPSGNGSHNDACELLFILTNPQCDGDAQGVTDGTVRLIKAVHDVGNYGVHVDDYDEEVDFSLAAAMCFLGVELFRRLAQELPSA